MVDSEVEELHGGLRAVKREQNGLQHGSCAAKVVAPRFIEHLRDIKGESARLLKSVAKTIEDPSQSGLGVGIAATTSDDVEDGDRACVGMDVADEAVGVTREKFDPDSTTSRVSVVAHAGTEADLLWSAAACLTWAATGPL